MRKQHATVRPLLVGAGMVALALAGAGGARSEVFLNEITVQGTEMVELYNSGVDSVDVNGWTLQEAGSWIIQNAPMVPPGGYSVVNPPGDIFGDQGGYIELLELTTEDAVYYGQIGSAPLPPDAGYPFGRAVNVSLARAPDGSTYSTPPTSSPSTDGDIWTIDVTPTFGAVNDAPTPALGTSLILNELDPKPVGGGDMVELYNPFPLGLPLTGWFLCNGDAFLALAGTVPGTGYLAITTPAGFDLETDEVVYLFRDDEVRVDQIGLHLPPVRAASIPFLDVCQCFARFPNGAPPFNGWDWFSSGGDTSLLKLECTAGAANAFQTTCTTSSPGDVKAESWSRTKVRYR